MGDLLFCILLFLGSILRLKAEHSDILGYFKVGQFHIRILFKKCTQYRNVLVVWLAALLWSRCS